MISHHRILRCHMCDNIGTFPAPPDIEPKQYYVQCRKCSSYMNFGNIIAELNVPPGTVADPLKDLKNLIAGKNEPVKTIDITPPATVAFPNL